MRRKSKKAAVGFRPVVRGIRVTNIIPAHKGELRLSGRAANILERNVPTSTILGPSRLLSEFSFCHYPEPS
jgi:hypothetical protein